MGRLLERLLTVSIRLVGLVAGLIAGFVGGCLWALIVVIEGDWAWGLVTYPFVGAFLGSILGIIFPHFAYKILESFPWSLD